ncbi:MAG: glycosyltransferase [Desulfovibrionaceae bacterium]|nr:glycosyltransferase [Desulfovibrionaceae bacterium]
MRKLRVLQVVNVRWFNATAWYALYLSRMLQEAGHEVLVLGLENTGSLAKAAEWGLKTASLPLNSYRPWDMLAAWRSLRRLIRDYKPNLVNCHRGEGFVLFCLLRIFDGGFALVRTRGDQRLPRNNLFNRLLYTRAADALIASNSRIAGIFLKKFAANPERVFTVLGGVDTDVFYPDQEAGLAVRDALGYGPEDFVVGLLGRLDPVKGHKVLIQALGLLRVRHPDRFNVRLLCLGPPSELKEKDILRLAEEAGLAGRVQATGWVSDVRAHINALDLGVLSSVSSEAIARAALEIMACDVPLLSCDIGVMPDILPPEVLVPPGDAPALSLALERCWPDPRDSRQALQVLENMRLAGREALKELRAGDFLEQSLRAYAVALSSRN